MAFNKAGIRLFGVFCVLGVNRRLDNVWVLR
jgi:hypothetical protein